MFLDFVFPDLSGKHQIFLEIKIVSDILLRPAVIQDRPTDIPDPEVDIADVVIQLAVFNPAFLDDAFKSQDGFSIKDVGCAWISHRRLIGFGEQTVRLLLPLYDLVLDAGQVDVSKDSTNP